MSFLDEILCGQYETCTTIIETFVSRRNSIGIIVRMRIGFAHNIRIPHKPIVFNVR
jgi:hypothetical protein